MIKEPDQQLRQVGWFAGRITDATILKIATAYYQACQYTYEPIFFAWRNKIAQFKAEGLDDMTAGWHNPFMQPRGVKSMEEINYNINYKRNSRKVYLE